MKSRSMVLVLTLTLVSLAGAEVLRDGWQSILPAQAAKILRELPTLPPPLTDADFIDQGLADPAEVELGRLLFFDKILSGNQNISCATCHHPMTGTADGLSLSVGEGGRGLGATRDTGGETWPVPERVPRNAPHVFNLGASQFTALFHDGRVEVDASQPSGFVSPAGDDLPMGLDSALAVQAMFPVTSGTEMAGQPGENELADLADEEDLVALWEQIASRLRAIPEYVDLFEEAYGDHPERPVHGADDVTYVHAANAIAAFEAWAWRSDDSPFDRYLRGDVYAMSLRATHGAFLFYGEKGCASCHSGSLQSDQEYHSLAVPQIGPGKGDGLLGHDDYGRERVTGDPADRYRFRTPTLRNVALTGPWAHDGAFGSLESMVRHHFDPALSLDSYDPSQVTLPSRSDLDAEDLVVHQDEASRAQLAESRELDARSVTNLEIEALLAFLHALTDPAMLDSSRRDVPARVPSGLPVYE